jgi:hypothetical protein
MGLATLVVTSGGVLAIILSFGEGTSKQPSTGVLVLGCRMWCARDTRSSPQEASRGNIDVGNKVSHTQDLASSGGAFHLA